MASPARPNVLWVFGDQHRGQATGYGGDPNVHTPNLDRLATEGLTFTHALAGSPLCSPARGSLLTGRYPHAAVPGHEEPLPAEQQTIGHVFRAAGYRTAYFGKWHLDGFKERAGGRAAMHIIPPERRGGFDHWVAYENNNSAWDSWVHGGAGEDAFHRRLPTFETDALTDLLIAYLETQAKVHADPFFAVLSVQPPHDPYVAPAEWMARHTPGTVIPRANVPPVERVLQQARRELAGYYAMIENLDWNVGRLRSALASLTLTESTHLIFFADHGDMLGSHGQFRKTAPWEEAVRVPLILAGGKPQYGWHTGFNNRPIGHVDLAPTTLGLCGLSAPSWMQGTDYSSLRLTGVLPNAPDSAFLQIVRPTGHFDSVDRAWRGVVTRDGWKYVVLEGQPWLLFNLSEDPYELVNLAHDPRFAPERARLQALVANWVERTGDHFPLPLL